VILARWRLADLPRLLAVDSRLSDRTVVRSRREFRQHAPTTFCFLDLIILIIVRQIFLGPEIARAITIKFISNPSETCFPHVSHEQAAWSHVKVSRDHEVLDPRSNFDIKLLRSSLLIERVFFFLQKERCVRKYFVIKENLKMLIWKTKRDIRLSSILIVKTLSK